MWAVSNAQISKFKEFPMFNHWNYSGSSDSTIVLRITSTADNGTDNVNVTGTNSKTALTDSTYWLINQEDVAVTWANADVINKYDGWRSTSILAHGLAANGNVRIGLACKYLNGDTTAVAQRVHSVTAFGFPYTFPFALE